jgi:hypothetical protein
VIDELMAPSSSPGHRWSCLSHSKQARRSKLGRAREIASCTEEAWRVCEGPGGRLRPACACSYLKANLCRPVHIVHASREAPGDNGSRRHGGTSASPSAKRRVMSASAAVGVFLSSEPACCGTGISGVQSMKTHPIARHVSKVDCGSCC